MTATPSQPIRHDEVRTYEPGRFRLSDVIALKRNFRMQSTGQSPTISVVISARNRGRTIGNIVEAVRSDLQIDAKLVDEILVVDHDSMDETAIAAQLAGAKVVRFKDVLPSCSLGGRGSVMRKGAWAAGGDIIVFIDGDHLTFESFKVVNLIAPLLRQADGVVLTKGYYAGMTGGRSTETMGRAAISMFDPELAALQQPFTSEQAIFRDVFADLTMAPGWYADFSVLHQVKEAFGASAIAQVDLEFKDRETGGSSHITTQVHELLVSRLSEALEDAGVDLPGQWQHISAETGSAEIRSAESGSAESGASKTGAAETVPGEDETMIESLPPLSSLEGWQEREAERSRWAPL